MIAAKQNIITNYTVSLDFRTGIVFVAGVYINVFLYYYYFFFSGSGRETSKCMDECQNTVIFFFGDLACFRLSYIFLVEIVCHILSGYSSIFFFSLLSLFLCVCMFYSCAYACVIFVPKVNGISVLCLLSSGKWV